MMSGKTRCGRASLFACLLALGLLIACAGLGTGVASAVNTPPKITKQPVNATVEEGLPASFNSTASGSPTPTQQWEVSTDGGATFSPIEGATSNPYTIAATTFSENGYQFRSTFKNV